MCQFFQLDWDNGNEERSIHQSAERMIFLHWARKMMSRFFIKVNKALEEPDAKLGEEECKMNEEDDCLHK